MSINNKNIPKLLIYFFYYQTYLFNKFLLLFNYISKFSLDQIIEIESKDSQFLSLKNARKNISKNIKNPKEKITNQNLFLFLILQNGLISYQIAGSGENRREEFSQKLINDRNIISNLLLTKQNNINRRYDFLCTSKYNKRIYNIKKKRLEKFNIFLENFDFNDELFFSKYYNNMYGLLELISKIMQRSEDSKTLTFAIKMFGYGARIVFDKIIYFPKEINIPIDSRLKKIYEINTGKKIIDNIKNKKQISKYFYILSKKSGIPPLHLDSLLRIKYRKNYIKN